MSPGPSRYRLSARRLLEHRLAPALAAVAILLATGGTLLATRTWSVPVSDGAELAGSVGGPFRLVGADGRTVTDADFRGRWMLIYFGFTRCPDACPTALNNIANALDLLKADGRAIAPIFITVDPARDTPAVIGQYASLFGTHITGLTGTQAQIDGVEHAFRVYAARHPTRGGDYTMDHSSIIYVMDPHGRFVSFIDGAASAEEIAAKARDLVRGTPPPRDAS